jgi:hypothetical protein
MTHVYEDDKDSRMKSPETAGRPRQGSGGTDLHRIDLDRVTQTLGSTEHAAGYVRLEMMLNAVLPRFVGETPGERAV